MASVFLQQFHPEAPILSLFVVFWVMYHHQDFDWLEARGMAVGKTVESGAGPKHGTERVGRRGIYKLREDNLSHCDSQ